MKSPLVSIIIVVYNNQTYIERCLDSVLVSSYPRKEILVVNNASTDTTGEVLSKYKRKVIVMNNTENLGYAQANNYAFSVAKGEYILVLNPDTMVSKGFLEPLVELMQSSNKIAACQPAVFLLKQPKILNLTGKVTHYLGFDWIKDYKSKELPEQQDLVSISGCAILLNGKAIRKAGYFDESYFMYYEDSDLSWKLRLLGFRLVFQPKSLVYHDYKLYPPEHYLRSKRKLFLIEKNRVVTVLKNYSVRTLISLCIPFLITELAMVMYALMAGWGTEKLMTYWEVLKSWNTIQVKRRFIQQRRKLSDKEIFNDFESSIGFMYGENPVVKWLLNPFLWIYWQAVRIVI